MVPEKVLIFDTTLRDGSQAERVNFSVEDKVLIAQRLDEFGIDYVEGGWPGSNPRDIEFFERCQKLAWKHARITAFGSTAHPRNKAKDDKNLLALIATGSPAVCIFGKTWDLHVTAALQIGLEQNLEIIHESVCFLKSKGLEVIFDAEHFFDGYFANPEYALKAIKAAADAGADNITLAETNGGRLPFEVVQALKAAVESLKRPVGIHTHNDAGCAVANTLVAVEQGAVLVQGTINGYGERCGNANLCSILPALKLKMKIPFFADKNLEDLTELSHFISEAANLEHDHRLPYVGESAFAHKGGIHVSAVKKDTRTYEHVPPESVGNIQRVLVTDLAGKSNILHKMKELGIELPKDDDSSARTILTKIKQLENEGLEYESADASLELLIQETLGRYVPAFRLKHFRLIMERDENNLCVSEGVVEVRVREKEELVVATGNGPVNAIDNALRKALEPFYPDVRAMSLIDYKVRVLGQKQGTDAKVRVLIESRKGAHTWTTVGVSENVIDASWQALVDSIEFMLYKKY